MDNEPEAPQWMKDMFYELSAMFEELFPDEDRLNLEEMQRKLDKQQAMITLSLCKRAPARRQCSIGIVSWYGGQYFIEVPLVLGFVR